MRFFSGFMLGGIAGGIAGMLIMLILFPFLFPPPMVNETVEGNVQEVLVTEFRQNVRGHDAAHWGRGDIKVYRDDESGDYLLEFQNNFEAGPGPNFWLYLNTVPDIDFEEHFKSDAGRIRLTKIKSFQGSQVYEVSAADYEKTKAITIWCESFHQYIASANLS